MERGLQFTIPVPAIGSRYGLPHPPLLRSSHIDEVLPVGFSYSDTVDGSINPVTGVVENSSFAGVQGRYPTIDATLIGNGFFRSTCFYLLIR